MGDVISSDMTTTEIENVLNEHDIKVPNLGWIALMLLFNTYGHKLYVIGYGEAAYFQTVE